MDVNNLLWWLAVLSAGVGLVGVVRERGLRPSGWLVVFALVLATAIGGLFFAPALAGYVAGALWALLVLAPALALRWMRREVEHQRYRRALFAARLARWLHPADGWREQPFAIAALEHAQRGDLEGARRLLLACQASDTALARSARVYLWRIGGQWEDIVWLCRDRLPPAELAADPSLVVNYLRALGETGRVDEIFRLYRRLQPVLDRPELGAVLDAFYLFLFAFSGRPAEVERVFQTRLASVPEATRRLWLATARLFAGEIDEARAELAALRRSDDPLVRQVAQQRLERGAPSLLLLAPEAEAILDQLARRLHEEERYSGRASERARTWVTFALIAANCAVFLVEILAGGSTDGETLIALGALAPELARAGAWWRLLASTFLHFGPLHLALNMAALYVLGRYVEFSLGALRYLVVYLCAGLAGGFVYLGLDLAGLIGPRLVVGASGSVMGMVGAQVAIFLGGWTREHSSLARRRLASILPFVGLQALFDLATPQVSFIAHASGFVAGFLVTLLVRRRASAPAPGARA